MLHKIGSVRSGESVPARRCAMRENSIVWPSELTDWYPAQSSKLCLKLIRSAVAESPKLKQYSESRQLGSVTYRLESYSIRIGSCL